MTQSGQGEEPSAQPAHEGIVLPSDGGEPVLPGMTGAPAASTAPPGGQAWGGSWGPGEQAPQPGQGWPPAEGRHWGTDQQPPSATGPGPLPPEGAPAPTYGGQAYGSGGQAPAYGSDGSGQTYGSGGPGQAYGAGGQDPAYGASGHGPAYGSHGHDPAYGAGQQPAYGAPDPAPYQHQQHQQPYDAQHQQQYDAPLPPAQPDGYPAQNAPLPPAADGATQYIPPVPAAARAHEGAAPYLPPAQAAAADGATQYIPPVPAAPADEGATQYIPPVTAGALPPEAGADRTQFLGLTPQQQPQQQAPASAADATQLIPPYGGDPQPPAGFENLFRSGPAGGDSPAGSTQQLPRVEAGAYPGPAQPPYISPRESYNSRYDDDDHDRREGGRSGSRVPVIAAIGVGIAVVGIGAGALLSGGGGGGGDKVPDDKNVAASTPAQNSASPAADPARQQAVALDQLLSDSGSSRASVIKSVADVKQCDNLDDSASNLRDAAKQRNGLVTSLGKLSVDKLPASAELTAALTKAWQASASADSHYAAWADQAGRHHGCRHGHPRYTSERKAGDRESGVASEQKLKAAALWNVIAKKYGLTVRQPTQL
ncbi:hypothetical protein [Streptomyces sp. NPDC002671]